MTRRDVALAAAVAAVVSGAPSTAAAVVRGDDPLRATRAAGSLVLGEGAPARALVCAGAVVHAVLSLWWASVLAVVLPRRHTVVAGAAAGGVIAAIDLGVVGRRFPAIRALALGPQVADHVAFGACAGAVLNARRCPRAR